eukprot:1077038-Amphidinium_carterae.2
MQFLHTESGCRGGHECWFYHPVIRGRCLQCGAWGTFSTTHTRFGFASTVSRTLNQGLVVHAHESATSFAPSGERSQNGNVVYLEWPSKPEHLEVWGSSRQR